MLRDWLCGVCSIVGVGACWRKKLQPLLVLLSSVFSVLFCQTDFGFVLGCRRPDLGSRSSADLISISSKLAQSKIWSSASYWPEQLRRCLASTGTSSWSTSFSSSTFLCTWKERVDAQWRGKSKDPHPRNLAQMPAAPIVQLLRPSCASHLVTQILVGCVSDPYCITETSRPALRAPLPFRPSCLKVCLISRYPR